MRQPTPRSGKSPQTVRLNKYLSQAGVASRRGADELIGSGKVMVNKRVVRTLGTTIVPERDVVTVNGREITRRSLSESFAFYKPRGVVSTLHDEQGRPSLAGFLPEGVRLYPAGRLDKDSEGLLILTNDGDLALRLAHPRFGHEKTYRVWLEPSKHYRIPRIIKALSMPRIVLGKQVRFSDIEYLGKDNDGLRFRLVLKQGLNRQIRRMVGQAGFQVVRLVRTQVGSIELGDLVPGELRELTPAELPTALQNQGSRTLIGPDHS